MKQQNLTIIENKKVSRSLYAMRLEGDDDFGGVKPGSFVNVSLPGFFLRRPISVCDAGAGTLTIVYKVLGAGTDRMTSLLPGETLDVLTELGNGFDVAKAGKAPILAGGGVGAAPMLLLAKELSRAGVEPTIALGFETAEDVFFEEEFAANASKLLIATADGSRGVKGLVTDAIAAARENPSEKPSYIYACGPEKMLKAVFDATDRDGEFSFEERMGCGFGACMGCSRRTKTGYKRVCKDGPVFERGEIVWQI